MAEPRDRLSDPYYAAPAWDRDRRLMRWIAVAVALALGWLWTQGVLASVHIVIASALGVGGSVLLAATLIGTVFLSSGARHDGDASESMGQR